MPTTITRRSVLVRQLAVGADLLSSPELNGVDPDKVMLTAEYLGRFGGRPYHLGEDWGVTLSLLRIAAGIVDGIVLTGATITMTIFDPRTRAVELTKTATIPTPQGSRVTGGNAGDFDIAFVPADTMNPGFHWFEIECVYPGPPTKTEVVARGVVEVRLGKPT